MTKRRLILTTALLALTVGAAPAAADAAPKNKLMGAPTFETWADQFHAVAVTVQREVPRKNGKRQITMSVAGKAVTSIRYARRHGSDYVYEGRVPVAGFKVGRKYTLKIAFPGQPAITRTVTLKEIPGERSPF